MVGVDLETRAVADRTLHVACKTRARRAESVHSRVCDLLSSYQHHNMKLRPRYIQFNCMLSFHTSLIRTGLPRSHSSILD
jgi:hypothetical protein